MKDIATTPLNLLTETRRFLAPCWHRRYVWPTEFSVQLLENVLRAGSNQHYVSFGVVTVGIRPQDPSNLMIVDVNRGWSLSR